MIKESKIERDIKKYLSSLNAYFIKGDANSKIGTPDILTSINGRFVAIEVKKEGESPRINQLKQINTIRESGALAFYATNVQQVKYQLQMANII